MNSKEKVIDAITHFENQQTELAVLEAKLESQKQIAWDARQAVCRTLRAVYGGRAEKGVVLRGKRYAAAAVQDGSSSHTLIVVDADFEVLG